MSLAITPVSPFLASDSPAGMVYAPTECTVAQAAELFDASEGFVNELLDDELVTFRLINGQRLIQWSSLLEFKQDWDRRHAACTELIRSFHEAGLTDGYDDD